MFMMNCLVLMIGDCYLYKLANVTLGRQGATLALLYSLFNWRINEIFQKTLTNGVESVFCVMGLYYYSKLRPQFDKNMALMVFAITIAFIVRSSSLVGWIPLALFYLF